MSQARPEVLTLTDLVHRAKEGSVTCYLRGHLARYYDGAWRYEDGAVADHDRPCVRCGRMPGPGGEDACLGHLPGVTSACCGHGVEEAYTLPKEKQMSRGAWQCDPACEMDQREFDEPCGCHPEYGEWRDPRNPPPRAKEMEEEVEER